MMRLRPLLFIAGFLLAVVAGYLVAKSAAPQRAKPLAAETPAKKVLLPHELPLTEVKFRKGERPAFGEDREAMAAGALVGQRTLKFKDRAALEAFLAKAGNKVRVMGRLDALNVLRIGFLNYGDLADLLDGTEKLGMIFPAVFPENESVGAQPGAVAFGNQLLEWLGITGDNSGSGKGVKVAILDTGVNSHSSFGGQILAMLGAGDVNGHGTAVASMIAGNTRLTPGVAPLTTLLSYQIGDAQGYSDSFKIAEAILAAVDAGANVIN
ncbi:MAG TPA: S8 family serine peptidase, partial [Luteolibacter sp.]|nr:S8 family serine peptidase [Luteolibacter sp.]